MDYEYPFEQFNIGEILKRMEEKKESFLPANLDEKGDIKNDWLRHYSVTSKQVLDTVAFPVDEELLDFVFPDPKVEFYNFGSDEFFMFYDGEWRYITICEPTVEPKVFDKGTDIYSPIPDSHNCGLLVFTGVHWNETFLIRKESGMAFHVETGYEDDGW